MALKGPLGNIPAFRSRLQDLLGNEDMREQLLKELDILNQNNSSSSKVIALHQK